MAIPLNTNPDYNPSIPMAGFVFRPSSNEIFSHFLPKRLMGQQILPPPYDGYVRDIDIYFNLSPKQLFDHYHNNQGCLLDDDDKEFYLFTTLKKKSKKKYIRTAGLGTWSEEKPDPCFLNIQGEDVIVGKKKLFKFKYPLKKEEQKTQQVRRRKSRKQDEAAAAATANEAAVAAAVAAETGASWIMHEYSMKKSYIIYLLNKHSIDFTTVDIQQLKRIVYCHVHKKVDKQFKQRKQIPCLTTRTPTTTTTTTTTPTPPTANYVVPPSASTDGHEFQLNEQDGGDDDEFHRDLMNMLTFDDEDNELMDNNNSRLLLPPTTTTTTAAITTNDPFIQSNNNFQVAAADDDNDIQTVLKHMFATG